MVLVAGREDTQREKRLISMLAKSVSRWAASVMMAKLCARYPPVTSRARTVRFPQRVGSPNCVRQRGHRPAKMRPTGLKVSASQLYSVGT